MAPPAQQARSRDLRPCRRQKQGRRLIPVLDRCNAASAKRGGCALGKTTVANTEQSRDEPGLLGRVLHRATSRPVLTIFAALHAAALAVVSLRYLLSLKGPVRADGQVGTGDYMAFFTAATLIREGKGRALYDLALQRRTQMRIIGRELDRWQPYQNPPALALVLAATAGLSYVHSFYIFTLGMVAAMAVTVLLLRRAIPAVCSSRERWIVMALLVASFYPNIRTMVGGQNTPLSLLLLSGLYASLVQRRTATAGAFLGLLSYKPQFGALPALMLAVQGERRTLLVAAACVAAHYVAAALACGWSWPAAVMDMFVEARSFEWTQNLRTHFSLWPFLINVLPRPLAQVTAAAASLGVVVYLISRARRFRADAPEFPLFWGIVITGTLLCSPHLQYYDAGLLVLPVLLGLDYLLRGSANLSLGTRGVLAIGYLTPPLYSAADTLGFQPLFVILVALLVWLVWLLRKAGCRTAGA